MLLGIHAGPAELLVEPVAVDEKVGDPDVLRRPGDVDPVEAGVHSAVVGDLIGVFEVGDHGEDVAVDLGDVVDLELGVVPHADVLPHEEAAAVEDLDLLLARGRVACDALLLLGGDLQPGGLAAAPDD